MNPEGSNRAVDIDAENGLPEGWELVTLPGVCDINPPKPPPQILAADAPVTFVPMPAVDAERGAITGPETRPFSQVRKGYTSFREEDVIMAKITPCMENGKAAIARRLENGLGFGSTEFHVFRSNGAVLPEFIYYFIRQPSFRMAAEAEMTGSVGQKRVPVSFLQQAEIPLPPLAEQKRIVAKVEELLARVNATGERLAKVPAILKRFRQAVLAAACSGRLTEDWRESQRAGEHAKDILHHITQERKYYLTEKSRKPRAEEKTRVADPVLPEILTNGSGDALDLPDRWLWVRFGSVIGDLKNGISIRPNMDPPGTPILRINSVRPGAVLLQEVRYLPESEDLVREFSLRDGDLLFTRYNGSIELLGVCGMVRELKNRTIIYPDKLMRVRFDHQWIIPEYVEIFFGGPSARDRITEKAKSSAGQQGVSGKDIKGQPVALAPLSEQHEIVGRVTALFKLADTIEKRVATATQSAERLTQAILAKAFRGDLVPTEAELARRDGRSYESASGLLAGLKLDCGQHTRGSRAIRKPRTMAGDK